MKPKDDFQHLLPAGYRDSFVVLPKRVFQWIVYNVMIIFFGMGLSFGADFPKWATWGLPVGLLIGMIVGVFIKRMERKSFDRAHSSAAS